MSTDEADPRTILIRNERTKLRATALNGLSIASIAAGFITPLAAPALGVLGAAARGTLPAAVAAPAFLAIGCGLHGLTVRILGRPV